MSERAALAMYEVDRNFDLAKKEMLRQIYICDQMARLALRLAEITPDEMTARDHQEIAWAKQIADEAWVVPECLTAPPPVRVDFPPMSSSPSANVIQLTRPPKAEG